MSNSITKNRVITTSIAISNFISVHGDRYDYSNFKYSGSRKKGVITCRIHGDFLMTYDHHYSKGQNCPNCAKNKKQNTELCILKFKEKHGDRYDYSLVKYKNNRTRVKIICRIHGVFEQEPLSHKIGRNCPECALAESVKNWEIAYNLFVKKHGDNYIYHEESYTKMTNKMRITCKYHGDFHQTGSAHASGHGCKLCTMYYGWGKKPYLSRAEKYNNVSHLYICKMTIREECFYKIGISYEGFLNRYRKREREKYSMELICQVSGGAELIWDIETQILRSMREYKYKPKEVFAGSTECLSNIDDSVFDALKILEKLNSISFC